MIEVKNHVYFAMYAIQCVLHEIKLLLFRAYVFLIFALRLGGAIVISAVAGGAFYALKSMETNMLSMMPDGVFSPVREFREAVLTAEVLEGIYVPSYDYGYEIVVAMIVAAIFVVLRVVAKIISPVVFAFPMPRRPLPPVLRWIPPEHKIHAVKASIAAPKRRKTRWGGDVQKIVKRLPENLQTLLRLDAPQEVAGNGQRVVSHSTLPEPTKIASVRPVPAAPEVAQPARPKRKPAAPPLPRGASA